MEEEGRYVMVEVEEGIFVGNEDEREIKRGDDEVGGGWVGDRGEEGEKKDVERVVRWVWWDWNIEIVGEESR